MLSYKLVVVYLVQPEQQATFVGTVFVLSPNWLGVGMLPGDQNTNKDTICLWVGIPPLAGVSTLTRCYQVSSNRGVPLQPTTCGVALLIHSTRPNLVV